MPERKQELQSLERNMDLSTSPQPVLGARPSNHFRKKLLVSAKARSTERNPEGTGSIEICGDGIAQRLRGKGSGWQHPSELEGREEALHLSPSPIYSLRCLVEQATAKLLAPAAAQRGSGGEHEIIDSMTMSAP